MTTTHDTPASDMDTETGTGTGTGTAYGLRQAAVYDAVYGGRGKDWVAEGDELAALIREHCPHAATVLDVACGTGSHLRRLVDLFDRADGLELSEAMCDIASRKVPSATVIRADMRDFDLGRTYDAVLCLCYSIGYSTSVAELRGTVARLAAHTAPGGVCVVEPWWFPERFLSGYVTASSVTEDGRAITRLSHSVRDGDVSRMTIRYVVADAAGIEDFTQVEVHSLFPLAEYLAAFEQAGLAATYHEGGPNGRGIFTAVRA